MADYDPETQPDPGWSGEGGYGGPDEPQSATEHSDSSNDQNQPQATSVANGDSEDAADYDPESVSFVPTTNPDSKPLKPSPQPLSKKRKTAGGFLVGDSDSEDDQARPGSAGRVQQEHPKRDSQSPSVPLPPINGGTPAVPSSPSPTSAQAVRAEPNLDGPNQSHAGGAMAAPAPVSYDPVALLEMRVKEDPRGALDAWLSLMAEYRQRNHITDSRDVYERFLGVFPHAADIWVKYSEMELAQGNFVEAEAIFNRSLMSVPNVQLWTIYLDYIRRRNDLNDPSGRARQVVGQAYEFVLDNVGLDKDAGRIWSDYIQFIRLAPGTIGGSAWQDQQKMDQMRKTFQRAVCIPISNVNTLWKEYDQFEKGLNPTTGRKFLNERSPAYMTAKSANTALDNITRNLIRSNLPRLPPAPGFEGDQEFTEQVELWKRWIKWEKEDPLDLGTDEPELLKKRILYTYRQAIMALRFWPEVWVDAAEWCFENKVMPGGKDVGLGFLTDGIEANAESVLLALKHADRIETTYSVEEGDEAKISRGAAVKAPYSKVLDTLYTNIKSLKEREKSAIAKIRQSAQNVPVPKPEDDDDAEVSDRARVDDQQEKISALEKGFAAQTELLARTVSFVWIALARAMRRIQGKGNPNGPVGGMRHVFSEARQRGRLTSDVYVAMAQLEWHVYKDQAGAKIFERGAKLFPEDEYFMLEYLKFLHSRDDVTNARVVFETCVNRLTQKPALVAKARPLYSYFHQFESRYGELSQIAKLESRMAELFPDDLKLSHFSARFVSDRFDPIAARIIISPAAQLRPKLILPSIEAINAGQSSPLAPLRQHSPRPQFLTAVNSPKRPFPIDDFEDQLNPPKKIQRGGGAGDQRDFQRGESPLKGAAGRRLDQQRRLQGGHGGGSASSYSAAPAPIPRDITFLLSQIPNADSYTSGRLSAHRVVELLRETQVPDYSSWKQREVGSSGNRPSRHHGASQSHAHNRNVSSEYAAYGASGGRDSPGGAPAAGIGRTASPFGGGGGGGGRPAAYHRPESRDSYEPPPPVGYRTDIPPPARGFEDAAPPGGWAPPAAGYGPAASSQLPYGGYRY